MLHYHHHHNRLSFLSLCLLRNILKPTVEILLKGFQGFTWYFPLLILLSLCYVARFLFFSIAIATFILGVFRFTVIDVEHFPEKLAFK